MPEKSTNEIRRDLREQYDKGNTCMQRDNFDYAIAIYTGVLQKEPAFLDCRRALRTAQVKKHGASTGFFKKVMGAASNSPQIAKAQMLVSKNPLEAINVAEQILNGDPTSAIAHKILANAAMAADLPKTAVLSLEIVRNQSPKDKAVGMDLAKAYGAAGMGAKADGVLNDLRRLFPTDGELNTLQKHLSATRTLNEGGYGALADGKGSFRDILKDKKEAVSLEQQSRAVKDENAAGNLIQQYESQLRSDPGNIKIIRDLGDLYAQQKNYDKALEYYQLVTAEGGVVDAATEKIISDLNIKKFDHALTQIDPQAPDATAQTERIKGERAAYILADAQRRAEKYPNDLLIKFEVGVLYYQMGRVGEAISEFQKSQSNQHKRIQSMNYLAMCFAARNMNDMAARKLQEAIKEKPNFDDEKKELTYNLGCVYEKMGKGQEAVQQFEQIYQEDISYRDVEAKVNKFYNSGGDAAPPTAPPAG